LEPFRAVDQRVDHRRFATVSKESSMGAPGMYVSSWKIKEGKFDEYRAFFSAQLQ
jgi:hypothetical protein